MKKILVIDDESYVRRVLRKYLESEGFEVTEAKSGIEGLNSYNKHPFDLVITDIEMPEMNGFETIENLKNKFPEVNIIAMSGCFVCGSESLKKAKKIGATSVLQKPADYYRTVDAVYEALQID